MPLLQQIQIDSDSVLGIWQIDEEKDQLKWELQWGPSDIEQFQALSDHERSMHWLSSRVLLRKMMNTKSFIDLQIDENGKPYIKNFPQKVSISHSGKRVAVLLSNIPATTLTYGALWRVCCSQSYFIRMWCHIFWNR